MPAWYAAARTPRAQHVRQRLARLARDGVDDSALPAARADQLHDRGAYALRARAARASVALRARVVGAALAIDRQAEVGAEEAAPDQRRTLHAELRDDVVDHLARRRGGQRQHRDAPVFLFQPGQVAVRGAEVVAPLADAMRFVDGDQAQVEVR